MYLRVVAELNKLKEHAGRGSGTVAALAGDLGTHARAMLKRLAQHGLQHCRVDRETGHQRGARVVAWLKGKVV